MVVQQKEKQKRSILELSSYLNYKEFAYANLPDPIKFDKDLTFTEKLVYAEIILSASASQSCNYTNTDLGKLLDIPDYHIGRCIMKLEKKGYLYIEIAKADSEGVYYFVRKLHPIPKGVESLEIIS